MIAVGVHLLDHDAAVLDARARNLLEPLDQRRGLGAAVRLDEAEHDLDAAPLERLRLLEHAIGLADAGSEADVQLQAPALRPTKDFEEVLRALLRGLGQGKRMSAHRRVADSTSGTVASPRHALHRDGCHRIVKRIAFCNEGVPRIAKRNECP